MLAWLSSGARCRLAQLMPLPFTVSCFSKIHIGFTFLVPAHLGSPGHTAVKWVCVCVCVLSYCVPLAAADDFFDWLAADDDKKSAKPFFLQLSIKCWLGLIFPADGCKIYDSSYGHSFTSACCVNVVTCSSNACIDPGSAYGYLIVAGQSPRFQLLCYDGPLLRLINDARLFLQGPSRELARHWAVACVTKLQLHCLRLRVRLSAVNGTEDGKRLIIELLITSHLTDEKLS